MQRQFPEPERGSRAPPCVRNAGVATFLVLLRTGPRASFMNGLVDTGFVVLVGPRSPTSIA